MENNYNILSILSGIDELNNKGNKRNNSKEIFNDQKINVKTETKIKSNLSSEIPPIVEKMILEAKKYLNLNQDLLAEDTKKKLLKF